MLQTCIYHSWLIQFSDVRKVVLFALLAEISDGCDKCFFRIFYVFAEIDCLYSFKRFRS